MKRQREDTDKNANDFEALAVDTIDIIFSFLDVVELFCLRYTSTLFRDVCSSHLSKKKEIIFSQLVGRVKSRDDATKYVDYDDNPVPYIIPKNKQNYIVNTILETIEKSRRDLSSFCALEKIECNNLMQLERIHLSEYICRNLKVVDFTNCKSLMTGSLSLLEHSDSMIEELYLDGCKRISAEEIARLTKFLHRLRVLHLGGCSQLLNDTTVETICRNLPHLESIDLMGLNKITDRSVQAIFSHLKNLKYVNIDYCERIRLGYLSQQFILMEALFETGTAEEIVARINNGDNVNSLGFLQNDEIISCKGLQVANLSFGSSLRGGCPAYSLAYLSLSTFGQLKEVNVSSSSKIVDDDIKILFLTCGNALVSLEMRCCDHITDESLSYIGKYGHTLTILDTSACFKISNHGIENLSKCSTLTSLKVSSNSSITDIGAISLGNLKNLLVLDLKNCVNITSYAIGIVIQNCKHLVELDVRNTGFKASEFSNIQMKQRINFFNGKRCCRPIRSKCSFKETSMRHAAKDGIRTRRMYHCTQCNLLPKYGRGICLSCVEKCHSNHEGIFLGSISYFYCDCAFLFESGSTCLCIKETNEGRDGIQ